MKNLCRHNTTALFVAQLFGMMATIIGIFVGSLAGIHLAPTKMLATLPVASLVIGAAVAAYPSASFMKRVGRKTGNICACSLALVGAILGAYALSQQNFYLFCFSSFLVGINNAFVQQYRFAVIEGLPPKMRSFGVSALVFANAFSAFIGTEIAVRAKLLTHHLYVGSLLGTCLVLLISLLGLLAYKTPSEHEHANAQSHLEQKPITANIVPAIMIACLSYFMMAWIMVAMPISMHEMEHFSIDQAGFVMQSHLMAMFLPSLITGLLAKRLGNINMILIGFAALALSLVSNLTGQSFAHYWTGLVLLGIGWNFTFICGTTILTESYLHEHRFRYQGINDFFVFTLNALASLTAGISVLTMGWHSLNQISIVILVVMLIAGVVILVNQKRAPRLKGAG